MITCILLYFSQLQGSVDQSDIESALYWLSEDTSLGWPNTFMPTKYCLTDIQPYTIHIELEKGEITRYIGCVRPHRVFKWYCTETDTSCNTYHAQFL